MRRDMWTVMFVLAFSALAMSAPIGGQHETIMSIPGLGRVQGSYVDDGNVIQFLGIPYAAPPVGPLRFAETKPMTPWNDVWDATQIRPGCPQNCTLMKSACPETMSEDCLYLNVWMPSRKLLSALKVGRQSVSAVSLTSKVLPPKKKSFKSKEAALKAFEDSYIPLNLVQADIVHHEPLPDHDPVPVYVFIHGGMFTLGHAGTGILNATAIANTGLVVVTFNYRLGALGFLAHNDIQGNFGIQDQLFALKWVQQHIAVFGGDAQAVTLGGQSAGANSVAIHITNPDNEGLFHRATLESPLLGLPMFTQQQASYELGADFVDRLGCTSAAVILDCVRNASITDILDAQAASAKQISSVRKLFGSPYFSSLMIPWAPVVGNIVVDQPLTLIRSGNWKKVPIIAGFTKDEFASFTPTLVPELGKYSYNALVYAYFGLHVSSRVLETYPASDDLPDQRNVLSDVTRDMFVSCPLRSITVNNSFPAYLYRFDHIFNDSRLWAEYSSYCANYACHSSEVAAVFLGKGAASLTDGVLTEAEETGAEELHRYFVRFIKTGDPNDGISFPWPRSVGSGPYLRLEIPYTLTPEGVEHNRCDLWDDIGYFW